VSRGGRPGRWPDVLILSYHTVSASWPSPLALLPDRFEAQLRVLRRQGYQAVRVHDAIHAPPSGRVVAVTFDDGYRSVLEVAFPILERLGYVGSVFVPTDFPDQPGPMSWPGIDQWLSTDHANELRSLSWNELRELAAAGWEIGSHGCSHPDLPKLSDQQLEQELHESRRRIEHELGAPCRSLAYPFGTYDARVVTAVRAAGYSTACAVPAGRSIPDPLTYPRIGIYRPDGMIRFRVKTSPSLRRLRATPLAELLLPLARRRGGA
jgi:peptidoglycan/xylan/chitin deacetylase (PgdA/CDA1 family)